MNGESMRWIAALSLLVAASPAMAQVAEECADYAGPPPKGYDEGAQQDFLKNYYALATTFSPLHGPMPHEPGHGSVGVDIGVMPPLGCERRFVLDHTKTEDTNISPVVPRPVASVSFPAIGKVVPYIGFAYVPPVKVFGTTNVIISGEIGFGLPLGETVQLGGRFHATSQKTVGEIATPFEEGLPAFDDLYIGSTFGFDALMGIDAGMLVPYLALGLTDVSTFFYIGDDGIASNNYHPYFGPNASLGLDGLVAERFRFGAEFYAAPGGISKPDPSVATVKPVSRYGHLYTGRFRLAVEI